MKKGFSLLFVMMSFLSVGLLNAGIYQWIDDKGVTHFSDTPHEGASPVSLPDEQLYSSPNASSTVKTDKSTKKLQGMQTAYQLLQIAKPNNKETIWSNPGIIPVMVAIQPALTGTDSLQLLLDGSPMGEPQQQSAFMLTGVPRGEHKLSVQILNDKGGVVKTSEDVTVYLQKAQVKQATPLNPPK
jgi:hypothetical protein